MKTVLRNLKHCLMIRLFLTTLPGLLLACGAEAAVTVYGQGTYGDDYLELSVYADIGQTALVSYGIKVTYSTGELSPDPNAISAVKNSDDWYFGRKPSEIYATPNADPDLSTQSEVVIVGGKCDLDNPGAGVIGTAVRLATITYSRLNSAIPSLALYLGKSGSYSNFVQVDGQVLDGDLETGDSTIGTVTLEAATVALTTSNVTSISSTKATSGGSAIVNSSGAITAKGLCWSTSVFPTIHDSVSVIGSGDAEFTGELTNLSQGTTYHVRAYATNSSGTSYGENRQFATFSVISCPDASDTAIVLDNITFESGTECTCTASQSITTRNTVLIPDGASVIFNAPFIRTEPGFQVEAGALFRANP